MSHRFAVMIDRLIMFHRLESSRITQAFEDEIRMNLDSAFAFEKELSTAWSKWLENKSNLGNYLGFFRKEGPNLFKFWLTNVFPFDASNLKIEFPIGPSPVDIILNFSYTFGEEEMKILTESLQMNGLMMDPAQALNIIFSNAIKSIVNSVSKVFQVDYKIFTEGVETKSLNSNRIQISYRGAGRVQK
ncbi:MAG: hypothetical protein ACTSRW_07920 [Candidatus Helarchaeota archaeon]